MSTTTFVEATSADPFIRDLHRKAMRLLNDPSLDRRKREFHMRRLQSILIEHQAKQDVKAARLLAKKASREQVSRGNCNECVADPSQLVSRRKEYGTSVVEPVEATVQAEVQPAVQTAPDGVAPNGRQEPGRNRPVLTLKRA
jgi:hypothetical protein